MVGSGDDGLTASLPFIAGGLALAALILGVVWFVVPSRKKRRPGFAKYDAAAATLRSPGVSDPPAEGDENPEGNAPQG